MSNKDSATGPLQQTFGRDQLTQPTSSQPPTQQKSPTKPNKAIEKLNKAASASLPPGVEGGSTGSLFVEMGQMEWFTYDGVNYLSENGGDTKPITNLFANFKFWGESSKGIYLKMANGMGKGEKVTNRFRYDVKCPERTLEKYLDDMGVLVVDFFDTTKNQTVGTSKIMMKLYIKRSKREDDDAPMLELRGSFPITLTGNQNVKIGQFSISLITSFPIASRHVGADVPEQMNADLNESFIANEKKASQIAQMEKNRQINDKIFQDDRIPSSLQGKRTNTDYKLQDFNQKDSGKARPVVDFDIDERPTRERPTLPSRLNAGKENQQRNTINIDENEDTFHNLDDLAKILARGHKLKQQMDEALDSNGAWESLHGAHAVPKKYVPPFLGRGNEEDKRQDNLDSIYEIEIDGHDSKIVERDVQRIQIEEEDRFRSNASNLNQTGHISEMKFIKVKIVNLRIENEELLHHLIDQTFTITVDVPLPDIYQKKISFQQLKLNNYDVISFNEFAYNNSTLYNFKVEEETFNKLAAANLKVSLDGYQVTGTIGMIKLLMAKSYKLEVSVPLTRVIKPNEELAQVSPTNVKGGKKVDPKKGAKNAKDKKAEAPVTVQNKPLQTQSYQVGSITLELSLQRGESEEEISREYQIKLKKLEEQKALEDKSKSDELSKYKRYSQQQEPMFASLYLNIQSVKNLCLNQDGSIAHPSQEEGVQNNDQVQLDQMETLSRMQNQPLSQLPRRNLFVQYKAFPGLEKLKTSIIWQEKEPKFGYRSQFPVIISPDIIEKLQNFTFVLEVWDHIQPSREDFIGLVKIPLSSFCHSMRTSDEQIFSLNFLADQHCLYPMTISDGPLPIYSPRHGQNVGDLEVTLALGSSIQVNRQIQKEQENERRQVELQLKNHIVEAMKKGQETTMQHQLPVLQELPYEEPKPSLSPKLPSKGGLFSSLQKAKNGDHEEEGQNELLNSLGMFFKQSINVRGSMGRDFDYRNPTHLDFLRKLFEEARQNDFKDINGESEIFKKMPKNYDGTIKQADFIFAIVENKIFTLTRNDISKICALLLIKTDSGKSTDGNSIDLEVLQRSYRSYLSYYDSIEQRIKDLLEKFMLSIQKKIQDKDEQDQFIQQIEDKSKESKIAMSDFRDIFDNNGVSIRDPLYNQLSSYFDLDRNDHIFITSFCDFLKNPRMSNFNFFKVHSSIIVTLVSDFIKNEIQDRDDAIHLIEEELKYEIAHSRNQEAVPDDILLQERMSAQTFQTLMLKHGVQLSQWEIFTLFDYMNTTYQKNVNLEPQRYHSVSFPHFYRFITGTDYETKLRQEATKREQLQKEEDLKRQFELQQQQLLDQHQKRLDEMNPLLKASQESAFELAADLNNGGHRKRNHDGEGSEEGLYSSKSYDQITEQQDENEEVVIKKDKKKKKQQKEMTFAKDKKKKKRHSSESSSEDNKTVSKSSKIHIEPAEDTRPYKKVKHVFEIQVKELKNIPILDKMIKDIESIEKSKVQFSKQSSQLKKDISKNKYIQSVAVKYSFPLDEDEIYQSDFIQLNSDVLTEMSQYDYKVSINTVHSYVMNKEDPIQKLLNSANSSSSQRDNTSLFNISLVIYDNNKEYVIGNAQLPIEDLIDVVDHYNSSIYNGILPQKQTLSRILFIYGTTYSQRENCIIGKMQIEINYQIEKQILSLEQLNVIDQTNLLSGGELQENSNSCFLHRETFIKRKIPLNAILSVEIERINNLKESLENIEHFAKIQMSTLKDDKFANTSKQSVTQTHSYVSKNAGVIQTRDQTDRRRILTSIFKQGLNLVVIASVFDEDMDLKKKFPQSRHTSRLLYNTLTPIFNDGFEIGIQMDTNIFEYLKNKKAVFEVRHYIIDLEKRQGVSTMTHNRSDSSRSNLSHFTDDNEEKELMNDSDYITLGYIRVPLLHLITKNNGIDGDFVIFDDYKQQMGSLRLKISLNHHSSKRPLYSETNKIPQTINPFNTQSLINQRGTMIDRTVTLTQTLMRNPKGLCDSQYLLGLNFVELIFKDRSQQLFGTNDQSFMYLKFRLLGQNFQTKFISNLSHSQSSVFLRQLNITVFNIKKIVFIELDFLKQAEMEEAFSRPLEVQLWLKKDHVQRYHQPEVEQLLGSFFIELNDLGKIKNRRIKEQNGILQSYEGYFSLYDYQREHIVPDRLGCKILMIKKEYDTQLSDLEVLFHNLSSIENTINSHLDPQCKGHADLDDIRSEVQKCLQDPYQSLFKQYVDNLEYKSSDKVYYSPLLGQLPPFFRYAKRFDTFGVIERFSKELQSIDTHGQGFVPVNLFRSILEHELKIKEKIVLDFIQNLRETDQNQQLISLDVNLFSHSLRSHVDYSVLLRKLAYYYESKTLDKTDNSTMIMSSNDSPSGEEVILKIDIESALRLKNPLNELEPPNSFVVVQFPYQGCLPQKLQTHVVHKSSYPAWHQVNQQVRFTLTNDILRHLIDYPLEFEVYHQQPGVKESIQQIGVAHIDLSQMVFIDGVHQIGGYFHVLRKDRFKNGETISMADPHRLSMESLGQIKLGITTSTNLKRAVTADPMRRSIERNNSPIKSKQVDESAIIHSYYGGFQETIPSQTKLLLENSFNKAGIDLQDIYGQDLKNTLSFKMNELDELTRQMKLRSQRSKSPERDNQHRPIEQQYQRNFADTIGHNQNADLRSSFQPFTYNAQHFEYQQPSIVKHMMMGQLNPIQELVNQSRLLNEEDDEDLMRSQIEDEDNVFEKNISQSSKYQEHGSQINEEHQQHVQLMSGTFNKEYYSTFNKHQEEEEGTNIFTENAHSRIAKTENDDDEGGQQLEAEPPKSNRSGRLTDEDIRIQKVLRSTKPSQK